MLDPKNFDPGRIDERVVEVISTWLAIQMCQSSRPFCHLRTLLETIADEAVEVYDIENKNFLHPI